MGYRIEIKMFKMFREQGGRWGILHSKQDNYNGIRALASRSKPFSVASQIFALFIHHVSSLQSSSSASVKLSSSSLSSSI